VDTRAGRLTIGKVARSAGLSVDAVRYYEREGLIEPARSASRYRLYGPEAIHRLRFIRHAQRCGFSLAEIRELLALRATPGRSSGEVKARAQAKIAEIERRIAALRAMKSALEALVSSCPGRGPASECPILDALETSGPQR
jgi:MerR family mercuric resistance operon transcriptional regulator